MGNMDGSLLLNKRTQDDPDRSTGDMSFHMETRAARPQHRRRRLYQDDRHPFVLELDEETDSDILALLQVPMLLLSLISFSFFFTHTPFTNFHQYSNIRTLTLHHSCIPGLGPAR
jgi:hypothetical protein